MTCSITLPRRLRKRAISLIEGVLYLVVAIAVIVGGIVFFQKLQLSNAVTDTARAAVGISSQARALYQNHTGFGENEDLTLAMIRAGAVPSNFIDNSGDAIAHPFGGGVSVTGNGKGFVITYSGISQAACLRLASIDEVGVGPMGTGIVGLTIAQGESVDPTTSPAMTGTVKAEAVSASCTDGAVMAVYYAQNPGAKFTAAGEESSSNLDTDNPWGYPYPISGLLEACGSNRPNNWEPMLAWYACRGEWGTKTYGDLTRDLPEVCGTEPHIRDFLLEGKTVEDVYPFFSKAKSAWGDCEKSWQSFRFNR